MSARRRDTHQVKARLDRQLGRDAPPDDPPLHQLADRLIATNDFLAGNPACGESARPEFERLSLQLGIAVGFGRAVARTGRVLIPVRRGPAASCLVVPVRDLDEEELDEFEVRVIGAAERAMAGHAPARGDRGPLIEAFLLATDCSRAQAGELVAALAALAGLGRTPPPDLASFGHLAQDLILRLRPGAGGDSTDPPAEAGPESYRFPFEQDGPPLSKEI